MFEIINYSPEYEEELMKLIEAEGEDWEVYWKEPNATAYRKSFSQSITYLALADGKVCGYSRSMKDALFIYVCDLLVNSAYRGNGLGYKLMKRLHEEYPGYDVYIMSGNDEYYKSIDCKREGSVYLLK